MLSGYVPPPQPHHVLPPQSMDSDRPKPPASGCPALATASSDCGWAVGSLRLARSMHVSTRQAPRSTAFTSSSTPSAPPSTLFHAENCNGAQRGRDWVALTGTSISLQRWQQADAEAWALPTTSNHTRPSLDPSQPHLRPEDGRKRQSIAARHVIAGAGAAVGHRQLKVRGPAAQDGCTVCGKGRREASVAAQNEHSRP